MADDRRNIKIAESLFDRLNDTRQERGETWPEFLDAAEAALTTSTDGGSERPDAAPSDTAAPPEDVATTDDVADLRDDLTALRELAESLPTDTANELETRLR